MKTNYRYSAIIALALAGCATQPVSQPSVFLPPPPAVPSASIKGIRRPLVSAQVVTNPVTLLVSRSITPPPGVKLGWGASADTAVTGYNIYMGLASRTYNNVFSTTDLTLSISNLAFSTTYYFAATATAITTNGVLESDYSNELAYTTPRQILPPGTLSLQSAWASTLQGPWLPDTNWPPVVVANPLGNQFWRLSATLVP